MKRPQSIQINIPNPCSQNWHEMAPAGNGRHCAHCSTTVIDFTTWTDAELYNFIAGKKEDVCGRYFSTQLNRPINIPPQPHSRLYRMAVAMGLTLMFSGALEARAQINDVGHKSSQHDSLRSTSGLLRPILGAVKGYVIDEVNTAGGYEIRLLKGNQLKASCFVDAKGYFEFPGLDTGTYFVEASSLRGWGRTGMAVAQVVQGKITTVEIGIEFLLMGMVANGVEERDSTGHVPTHREPVKTSK